MPIGVPGMGAGAPVAGAGGSGGQPGGTGSAGEQSGPPGAGGAGEQSGPPGAAVGNGSAAGGDNGDRPGYSAGDQENEPAGTTGGGGGQSPGYWDVDLDRLQGFKTAIAAARTGLGAVQTLVGQMQGDAYTPKLGTSPVGEQLARKFDDRLNGDQGLRTLLAEAMRRLDQFIHGAEKIRDAYAESDQDALGGVRRADHGRST